MLVVVLGDGAVGGLKLRGAIGRHQHGGHHGQGAEGGGHHIAHHVTIIVLASPNKAALAADDPSYSIVNECVEIGNAQLLKIGLVVFKFFFKHPFERAVVNLGDGILGGEPQVLPRVDGVLEAGTGKRTDALFLVVSALPYGGTIYLLHGQRFFLAIFALEGQGSRTGFAGVHIHALIHITISVTGNGNGLFPVFHHGMDGVDENGGAEHRAVQNGADGTVGTFPHLGELGIFLHALTIGSNGGALDGHAQALGGIGSVHGDLILSLVAVQQTQIIVLSFQVHKGQDQIILDHLPQHTSHFIAVHLHQWRCHSDFIHNM